MHGKNSSKELVILNANIRRNYPLQSVYSFRELRDPLTVLCVRRKKLLLDQKDAQDDLTNKTQKIDAKLNCLVRSTLNSSATAAPGQKQLHQSSEDKDSDSQLSADDDDDDKTTETNASTQSRTPKNSKK